MKPLFVAWHLGLGDAIICNGLIRVLATRGRDIVVPSKRTNLASVSWMFSDLPNVKVVPVSNDPEVTNTDVAAIRKQHETLGLGLWSKRGLVYAIGWDRQFYEDAGIPFEVRWARFYAPPCMTLPAPSCEYAFFHHQPEQGRSITRIPTLTLYQPGHPPNIFWNLEAISKAQEIHVVNSCFLNLVESVPTPSAKRLALHNYARTDCGPPTLHKPWEILNKP